MLIRPWGHILGDPTSVGDCLPDVDGAMGLPHSDPTSAGNCI